MLICLIVFVTISCLAVVSSAEGEGPVPYAVLFDGHQNMLASQITYSYSAIGFEDWTSAITTAASRWNSAGFSGTSHTNARKPTIVKVSSGGDVVIRSHIVKDAGWVGQLVSDKPKYGTIQHFGSSTMTLNDDKISSNSNMNINTVLHEFGHRFGLDHTITTSNSVMTPSRSSIAYPQTDDRNGLARLWYRCTMH